MLRTTIEYLPLIIIFRLIRIIPYSAAIILCRLLANITFYLWRYRRAVVAINLKYIFSDPVKYNNVFQKKIYYNFLRMGVDFFRQDLLYKNGFDSILDCENLEYLDLPVKNNAGCILATIHFGNWEIMAAKIHSLGHPVSIVVQPMANNYIENLIYSIRTRNGIEVIYNRSTSYRQILPALQKKRYVALVFDQDAGDRGEKLQFLGKDSSTILAPAIIAKRNNVYIVPGFCVRKNNTKYFFKVLEPINPSDYKDEKDIMQNLCDVFTDVINQYPDQYLWFHKRWKSTSDIYQSGITQ